MTRKPRPLTLGEIRSTLEGLFRYVTAVARDSFADDLKVGAAAAAAQIAGVLLNLSFFDLSEDEEEAFLPRGGGFESEPE